MLSIIPIPAFKDNYIWLLRKPSQFSCVVIDPGAAAPVLNYLAEFSLTLSAILLTHHHVDHCGGVSELLQHYPVPVYGPADDAIAAITHPLAAGDSVNLAVLNSQFNVMHVPGHTHGHIAYYGHGLLFCGDTLFLGGCGRVFEGTPQQMYQSLCALAALPEDYLVYCAHEYTEANLRFARLVEPDNSFICERIRQAALLRGQGKPTVPAALRLEKMTNPFLRCHLPPVRTAVARHTGRFLEQPAEVFAALRSWKDGYKAVKELVLLK